MYVRVYACLSVCLSVCLSFRMYLWYVRLYKIVYLCICVNTNICICLHAYVYVYIYICSIDTNPIYMHVSIRTCIHMWICMHTCIHMWICMHTCIHMCICICIHMIYIYLAGLRTWCGSICQWSSKTGENCTWTSVTGTLWHCQYQCQTGMYVSIAINTIPIECPCMCTYIQIHAL